jgi:hypothetical protein
LVVERASDATLTIEEMDGAVETAANGCDHSLDEQETEEDRANLGIVVVNGGDTDDVDGGSSEEKDSCAYGFIRPEAETIRVLLHGGGEEHGACDHKVREYPYLEEVVEGLESGPSLCATETVGSGSEDEGIPGEDGEGADVKVFLSGKVRREVERVW